MKKVEIKVDGMHCSSCGMLIADALEDLGVESTKADSIKGTVNVEFDEQKLSLNEIKTVIKEEGYKVI